jgi:hypothetical protein
VSWAPSISQDAFSPEVGDFNAFASKVSRVFTLPVVSAEAFSPGVRQEANLLPLRDASPRRCDQYVDYGQCEQHGHIQKMYQSQLKSLDRLYLMLQ